MTVNPRRILVVGIYLAERETLVADIARELERAAEWRVDQRWVALGAAPLPQVARVTSSVSKDQSPKFTLLNRELATVDLSPYEYVLVCDDDIRLPPGFVDGYLDVVTRHGFALAQPARTHGSFTDHHFVEQLLGVEARETRFVEIGPLFSVRRDALPVLTPFDERSPMGWGYDFAWPAALERAGLTMGIVDAHPVAHDLRKPATHYAHAEASRQMDAFLAATPHLDARDAFQIVPSPACEGRRAPRRPRLSVLVSTHNRAELLRATLESLCAQTLPREEFEVVLVDDGSVDDTPAVPDAFADRLDIAYAYQRNAGLASARNHALFLARGEVVLLQDDDDVADPRLLEEHLRMHDRHPEDFMAVLGHTDLSPQIRSDPLMHFVTEVGKFLFSYGDLHHGQTLGFANFWGGRSSCKRGLLLRHGVFDPVFTFGCEDIELAWRLRRAGLRVIYDAHAVTTMVRAVTFDDFCRRSERQGRSNWIFSRLHPDAEVQRWTQVDGALRQWDAIAGGYPALLASARALDRSFRVKVTAGTVTPADTAALHEAYTAAFVASRIKGTAEMGRRVVARAA